MSTANDTVRGRIELALTLTPTSVLLGLMLATLAGFALLFIQEPLVHDALHDFRHTAGVTCH